MPPSTWAEYGADVCLHRDDIDLLAESNVGGLQSAIKSGTGSDANMKGLGGGVDAATNLLDDGRDIDRLETDIDTSKGATGIDVDLSDGTTIEVKNRDYNEIPEFLRPDEEADLTEKWKNTRKNGTNSSSLPEATHRVLRPSRTSETASKLTIQIQPFVSNASMK